MNFVYKKQLCKRFLNKLFFQSIVKPVCRTFTLGTWKYFVNCWLVGVIQRIFILKSSKWDFNLVVVVDRWSLLTGYFIILPNGTSKWWSVWTCSRYLEAVVSSALTVPLNLYISLALVKTTNLFVAEFVCNNQVWIFFFSFWMIFF